VHGKEWGQAEVHAAKSPLFFPQRGATICIHATEKVITEAVHRSSNDSMSLINALNAVFKTYDDL
jgi:hypothetical protein